MPRPKNKPDPRPESALLIAAEKKRLREEFEENSLSTRFRLQGYRTADPYR